jgi:YidC/Oxa1 family membrane protein insertase
MDTYRAFLAIGLSFIILLGYQYFFAAPHDTSRQTGSAPVSQPAEQTALPPSQPPAVIAPRISPPVAAQMQTGGQPISTREGRDIQIDTDLYTAVLTETGGGFKSFQLKEYKETINPDSPRMELVKTELFTELPLYFSWGTTIESQEIPVYTADKTLLQLTGSDKQEALTMNTSLASGLSIKRTMVIDSSNYLIHLTFDIYNPTSQPLQGAPFLRLTNKPFSTSDSNQFLFSGPAVLTNGKLEEIKATDLADTQKTIKGSIGWTAYEGTYFIAGIIPEETDGQIVQLTATGDKVSTVLYTDAAILPAQGSRQFNYAIYFGPKKLSILKQIGADLERIVNFGWFTVIAKPTLLLLNFIYRYLHNYGVAIILVTIIIKALFWPIAQKGMKSMRNMQKIQPKITKLREKYKADPTRMNQEMMNLYKTYKINPLGGCLPMVLQIPVFFALYKVLLQAIELRHAPFMLWITDLSAPDRLWAGLNLPYLGGIPVLTLLMGGSMFLQQKMTPTSADPTQAKIMMFLPIIFTFMFLNFASGLVLYWLVNNLLSIGQQYLINKAKDA